MSKTKTNPNGFNLNKPFVPNAKERKLLDAIFEAAPRPLHISEMAALAYPKKGVKGDTKGNSWARNSLRKLVAFGLVCREAAGVWGITAEGREWFIGNTPPPPKKEKVPNTSGNSRDTGPSLAADAV